MLKVERKKNWTRIQKDFFIRISKISNKHRLVSLSGCLSVSAGHAEGREKEKLDKDTEGFLHQNIKDIKQAQVSQSVWLSVCLS